MAQQIKQVRSVAVFVGRHGVGQWQQQEIDLAIAENTKREMPVIPVWLADAPQEMEMPHFLKNFTWVDFRATRLDPFENLMKGILSATKTLPVLESNTTGLCATCVVSGSEGILDFRFWIGGCREMRKQLMGAAGSAASRIEKYSSDCQC